MPDGRRLLRRTARALRGVAGRARRHLARARPPTARPPGIPREVDVEHTNLGPVLDSAVARVRRRMLPAGVDEDYDLAYEHFDLTHFLLQAPQFLALDRDPLGNFLGNGAEAKASPEAGFDMVAYLRRHPQRAVGEGSPYVAWLREGRRAGEIADPAPGLELMAPVLGRTPAELAAELGSLRSDLRQRLRTGRLGEMMARAAEIEPLVADAWPETTRPRIPPFFSDTTSAQVHAVHSCQQAAGFARARVLLVISDPRWGGGRRIEGHLAHAFARDLDPAEIVVVYTDRGGRAPGTRFPSGVREVDLAAVVEGMPVEFSGRVLVELLRSLRADVVVNINSMLLHRSMTTYGRALAASERLFVVMFGNEQLALGNWVGMPLRYFYRSFDLVEGVITDSRYLADWLVQRHQLPDEMARRIQVLSAPVDASLPVVDVTPRPPGRRSQVFWAGRFDRQKRVDLAFEVARRMPDVDFRLWGEPVLNAPGLGASPANVHLQGAYAQLSELELADADAWLYTSGWDGVPSQLLEVAMTGIPLVGSLVGGTGEVLDPELSWPVADLEEPDAYVAALRAVLAAPEDARRRARELREQLARTRTEAGYAEQVARILRRPEPGSSHPSREGAR